MVYIKKLSVSIALLFFLIISAQTTLSREQISTKIIENDALEYEHFFSANLFLDGRFGILIPIDIPISVANPTIFGPNAGIGLSYRFRPDFPVGVMVDADISPLDIPLQINGKSSAFKAWDFLISAGLLIQVYDNRKDVISSVVVAQGSIARYRIMYYVTVPETKVRNIISVRAGAMLEYNNAGMYYSSDDYDFILGDNIDRKYMNQWQQHSLFYVGVSWFMLQSIVIDILDQDVADQVGKRHVQKSHFDLYGDIIVDISSWEVGARIGLHFSTVKYTSFLIEMGHVPNKGMYGKLAWGLKLKLSGTLKKKNNKKTPKPILI